MKLTFKIDPVAKARPRLSKFGVYTPKKTKDFEKEIRKQFKEMCKDKPLDGPIVAHITYYIKRPKTVKREYPTVKPDIDNFDKCLLDSLNGYAYHDDSQIIRKLSEKAYAPNGFIKVELWKIE